jgi:hypothetical protein
MNFATMLSSGPMLTGKSVNYRVGTRFTPEAVAKQLETKRIKRHAKWRAHFAECPDMTGTTAALSNACGQAPSPTYHALSLLVKEVPPPVAIVGRIPPSKGNGRDQVIWKWIGE